MDYHDQISHNQIFQRAWRDARSPSMLFLALLPLLISALVAYMSFGAVDLALKEWLRAILDSHALYAWVESLLSHLLNLVSFVGILLVAIFLVLIVQLFLGIFYAPIIIRFVHARYYSELELNSGESLLSSLREFVKIFFRFLLRMLICLPLSLIPFLGAIVWILLTFYFFYHTMMLDVAGSILTNAQKSELEFRKRWEMRRFLAGIYLLGFIPFLNLFTPIFQILLLTHFLMCQKRELFS
ncbi:MAG: EI24 domain-containing protein [Wolinella sp.]